MYRTNYPGIRCKLLIMEGTLPLIQLNVAPLPLSSAPLSPAVQYPWRSHTRSAGPKGRTALSVGPWQTAGPTQNFRDGVQELNTEILARRRRSFSIATPIPEPQKQPHKMLPSRGLLRLSPALGLTRTVSNPSHVASNTTRDKSRFPQNTRSLTDDFATLPQTSTRVLSRQFGTALRNNGASLHGASTARRIGGPLAFTAASQQLAFSLRQSRNASTQSTIPAATAPDASNLADIAGTPVSLTGSDLLDIPEQIGFLKTLGLDYGWGPTSLMQTVLESVYVHTGLPWWASIAVVALGIRLALLKPALDASENSLRYQELLKDPKYQAATDEMKRSMLTGNHIAGAQARTRVSLMNRAAGYSLWKNFVPMLQLPIGIGMFRLIKGMSALPVPSFENGGILWFTDLTVADPLFILPIVTGVIMMAGMRVCLTILILALAKSHDGHLMLTAPALDTSPVHGCSTTEDDEDDESGRHAAYHCSCLVSPVRPNFLLLPLVVAAHFTNILPPPAVVPAAYWLEAIDRAGRRG